jgi:hypothetical protein
MQICPLCPPWREWDLKFMSNTFNANCPTTPFGLSQRMPIMSRKLRISLRFVNSPDYFI